MKRAAESRVLPLASIALFLAISFYIGKPGVGKIWAIVKDVWWAYWSSMYACLMGTADEPTSDVVVWVVLIGFLLFIGIAVGIGDLQAGKRIAAECGVSVDDVVECTRMAAAQGLNFEDLIAARRKEREKESPEETTEGTPEEETPE